jgi:hypothetical protein
MICIQIDNGSQDSKVCITRIKSCYIQGKRISLNLGKSHQGLIPLSVG